MSRRSFSKPSDHGPEQGGKPDLEQVMEHYGVDLKHRTSQMVRCPVHGDYSTPSCSVNLDKQLWNCHSCGAGGDSWELIKIKEGVDFDGARAFAASNGLADGDALRGGDEVRSRYDLGGSRLSAGSGAHGRDRAYRPAWRRR